MKWTVYLEMCIIKHHMTDAELAIERCAWLLKLSVASTTVTNRLITNRQEIPSILFV
jgi:hypothetical protein